MLSNIFYEKLHTTKQPDMDSKLMGDTNVVAVQKDAFMKFVQLAKYPDAH